MSQQTITHRAFVWVLVAVCALFAPALTALLAAADSRHHDATTAVFLLAPEGEYDRLTEALALAGARVLHEFPPDAVITRMEAPLAEEVASEGWALYSTSEDVPAALLASLRPGARRAAEVWAALRTSPRPPDRADLPAPPGDARPAPDLGQIASQALDPSLYQQSEYLVGRVAVNVVLIESDGSMDPSTENWTAERQQLVFQQVVQATSWWQALEPRAELQFVYQDHWSKPVRVSYEPIARPHYEDRLWISQAMERLGFKHSSYITAVRLLNRATRERYNADWVFTIFVVDSLNDFDNRFADYYFAYAYIHGPYMVVTYGNNGYGPEHMAAVVAHEMGHLFGALDEYAAANVPATAQSGYLGVENGNAEVGGVTDMGCIMRGGITPYLLQQLCPFTAGQVGWRDLDGDGVLDPVDTTVQVQADASVGREGVRLSGSAVDVPYPSPLRPPFSINRISEAVYRVNGGVWRPLPPADGAYDSGDEVLDHLLPPAPPGSWTIDVRAENTQSIRATTSSSFHGDSGPDPLPDVAIEAAVSVADREAQATVTGVATAPEGAGPVVAVEWRLDEGPWVGVPAADGEFDSPVEEFTATLAGLSGATHALRVRAAAQNPWVGCREWQQAVTIAAVPEETPPPVTSDFFVYMPVLASASP
ncbi:MAG: hypothetical protein HPY83_16685 [Anaerolineae bacterium]|nr:hypothetical protein [Anaerolineae bacterium]